MGFINCILSLDNSPFLLKLTVAFTSLYTIVGLQNLFSISLPNSRQLMTNKLCRIQGCQPLSLQQDFQGFGVLLFLIWQVCIDTCISKSHLLVF